MGGDGRATAMATETAAHVVRDTPSAEPRESGESGTPATPPVDTGGPPAPAPNPDQLNALASANAKALAEARELKQRMSSMVSTQDLLAEAKRDPLALLKTLGVEPNDPRILQGYLGDAQSAQDVPAWAKQQSDELAELKESLRKMQSAADERIQAERDNQRIAEIHGHIGKAAEQYPLLNHEGAAGRKAVTDYMVSYYEANQQAITWEQAATHVEQTLRDSFLERTKSAPYAALMGGATPPAHAGAPPAQSNPTIHNGLSGSAPATGGIDFGPEDPDDRLRWSLAKMQGN